MRILFLCFLTLFSSLTFAAPLKKVNEFQRQLTQMKEAKTSWTKLVETTKHNLRLESKCFEEDATCTKIYVLIEDKKTKKTKESIAVVKYQPYVDGKTFYKFEAYTFPVGKEVWEIDENMKLSIFKNNKMVSYEIGMEY